MYFKISFPTYKEEYYLNASSTQSAIHNAEQLMEGKLVMQLKKQISDEELFKEQLGYAMRGLRVKFVEEIVFLNCPNEQPFENE